MSEWNFINTLSFNHNCEVSEVSEQMKNKNCKSNVNKECKCKKVKEYKCECEENRKWE